MTRRRTAPVAALVAVVLGLLLPPSRPVPAGVTGVGVARCTFVDASRSVVDYGTRPPSVGAHERTLVTEIRYPAMTGASGEVAGAPAAARAGGYPTVVFAHGYDLTPDRYDALLDAWVRAGFVVAAPIFPDENASAVAAAERNTEGDLDNEPADLAFVTRALVADTATRSATCPVAYGLVDAGELALAGQSDGADAVATLLYSGAKDPTGTPYAARRAGLGVRAALVLSGSEESVDAPYRDDEPAMPMLTVQSSGDECNPEEDAVDLFRAVTGPHHFFYLLAGAHHLPPYDGSDPAAFTAVAAVTTRFLLITVRGADPGPGYVAYGTRWPAEGRMYWAAPVPVTPVLAFNCSPY